MMALAVHRWHTSYRAAAPLPHERTREWDAALRDLDVGDDVDAPGGDHEWICIRRVTLATRWAEDANAALALRAWRDAFATGVRRALDTTQQGSVVRYLDRRDAVSDMFYRAAARDVRRAWAWRCMGLLPEALTEPSVREVLSRAVTALAGMPLAIWPTLCRIALSEASTGAWTALMQSLAPGDWDVLLSMCPQTRAFHVEVERSSGRAAHATVDQADACVRALVDWTSAHPWIACDRRASIAVVVAARCAERAGSTSPTRVPGVLAAAASIVDACIAAATTSGTFPGLRAASARASRPIEDVNRIANFALATPGSASAALAPLSDALPEAPPLAADDAPLCSEWAGLAFLLNVVGDCDVVARLAEFNASNAADELSMQHVLQQVAVVHLGVPEGEPGIRALCGGWQPESDVVAPTRGTAALFIAACAAALCEGLRARVTDLGRTGDVEVIERVCRRPGRIRFEPGWIEVHMDSRHADVRLRAAALDFDPGFVPFLGCVVRFHYG
jgi:hypothetical protein